MSYDKLITIMQNSVFLLISHAWDADSLPTPDNDTPEQLRLRLSALLAEASRLQQQYLKHDPASLPSRWRRKHAQALLQLAQAQAEMRAALQSLV
jgi:hypothetical protein